MPSSKSFCLSIFNQRLLCDELHISLKSVPRCHFRKLSSASTSTSSSLAPSFLSSSQLWLGPETQVLTCLRREKEPPAEPTPKPAVCGSPRSWYGHHVSPLPPLHHTLPSQTRQKKQILLATASGKDPQLPGEGSSHLPQCSSHSRPRKPLYKSLRPPPCHGFITFDKAFLPV